MINNNTILTHDSKLLQLKIGLDVKA